MHSRAKSLSEVQGGMDSPLTEQEDTSVLLEHCWDRLGGLLHRSKERTDEHPSPPQGPPLPDSMWLPDATVAV